MTKQDPEWLITARFMGWLLMTMAFAVMAIKFFVKWKTVVYDHDSVSVAPVWFVVIGLVLTCLALYGAVRFYLTGKKLAKYDEEAEE